MTLTSRHGSDGAILTPDTIEGTFSLTYEGGTGHALRALVVRHEPA